MQPLPNFWAGKRVMVTGHTGFKGAWLSLWLHRLGAQVFGLSLPPTSQPNLFDLLGTRSLTTHRVGDIRDPGLVARVTAEFEPQVVFHLAAQALVRTGYEDPLLTFSTNVMGTANVLEAIRHVASIKVSIVVTTDKVYENREWVHPYRENDSLGGYDPYSASKAACEMVISSYRSSYLESSGVAVASARAGNVIGGGDWAVDRLIPDAVRAWSAGTPLHIRRPDAVRPFQHVLEPLAAYLVLAQRLWREPSLASAYNFGPEPSEACNVRKVIQMAQEHFDHPQVSFAQNIKGPHEAGLLTLDVAKAREVLGIRPKWSLNEAVGRSVQWYRGLEVGHCAESLCHADLDAFEAMP